MLLNGLIIFCILAITLSCPSSTTSNTLNSLEQVRISLGEWDDKTSTWSFVISFALYKNNTHALGPTKQSPIACVKDVDIFQGETTSYTYNVDDHLIKVGFTKTLFYESPWLYHVPIKGIKPLAAINYRVGLRKSTTNNPKAPDMIFRDQTFTAYAPPAPGNYNTASKDNNQETSLRVTIIGDIGQTQHSMKTRDSIIADLDSKTISPTIGIIVGDMSYADGGAERWDSWGRMMEPLASRIPIMVLVGNHEIEIDNVTHVVFDHYRHRFRMPGTLPEISSKATNLQGWKHYGVIARYDGGSSYYSMKIGPITFICLNTYNTFESGMQENFLKNELMNVDRKVTPFVAVMMHAPWYNSNAGHQNEIATAKIRKWAEPLLVQYEVSVVFSGHVHAYERNAGLDIGGKPKHDGPMYITIGDGGNHELFYNKWIEPTPVYSLYHDSRFYGHGHLIAYNNTHLKWGWVPNQNNGGSTGIVPTEEDADIAWVHPYALREKVTTSSWILDGWGVFFFICAGLSLTGYAVTQFLEGKNQINSTNSTSSIGDMHEKRLANNDSMSHQYTSPAIKSRDSAGESVEFATIELGEVPDGTKIE
jgi:acid phosphatase type 7